MDKADNRSSTLLFLLQVIAIILLAMVIRTMALRGMPLFSDEGHHITRAQAIAMGEIFAGFEHNKWLYTAVLALFQPLGPEGVWIGRFLSAMYGVVSTAGCIALGTTLGSRRAGLLAGLLYAAVPMAVFHERQALVDPQLTAFATFSILLSLHLARRPRVWVGGLLFLTLAIAYLTKATGLAFFVLPFAAILLWSPSLLDGLKSALIAGVADFAAYRVRDQIVNLALRSHFNILSSHQVVLEDSSLTDLLTPELGAKVLSDLGTYWVMLLKYVGWGGIALVALTVIWIVLSDRRRSR
jgi:predicted membrane-bound mannosyltransferase